MNSPTNTQRDVSNSVLRGFAILMTLMVVSAVVALLIFD